MAKLNVTDKRGARNIGHGVTASDESGGVAYNHEGVEAWDKDARTELYTLLVTRFAGEDTFYEKAADMDARLVAGIKSAVANGDDKWVRGLIVWARQTAQIRTASVIAAVEYARAGGSYSREVIDGACVRADEPGEVLAYWLAKYGRPIKASVKRGLSDACQRLYTARNYVKWDSSRAGVRFGDVIDLCHCKPGDQEQAALYRRAIEDRHGRAERLTMVPEIDAYKTWIADGAKLDALPEVATWENVAGQRSMSAAEWEAVIPKMGYMALLRNLRNFEQAGVGTSVLAEVAGKLSDPEQVARSRQLPFRFWSAWKHGGGMVFGPSLEQALHHSVSNIEALGGRTLVMVDGSGSMTTRMTKSQVTRAEMAALFGCALLCADEGVDVWQYDTKIGAVTNRSSVLRAMEQCSWRGGGTDTWGCTREAWNQDAVKRGQGYDRIIVITDEQAWAHIGYGLRGGSGAERIPASIPVYLWDLSGYRTTSVELGKGRYLFAGLNDACFGLIKLLEQGANAQWPWETVA